MNILNLHFRSSYNAFCVWIPLVITAQILKYQHQPGFCCVTQNLKSVACQPGWTFLIRIIHAHVNECGCTTILQRSVTKVDVSHGCGHCGTWLGHRRHTSTQPPEILGSTWKRPHSRPSQSVPALTPSRNQALRTSCNVESAALMRFCVKLDALRDPAPEFNGAKSNTGVDRIRAFLAESPPFRAPPLALAATPQSGFSISGSPPLGPRPSVPAEGDCCAGVPTHCWLPSRNRSRLTNACCKSVFFRPNSAPIFSILA